MPGREHVRHDANSLNAERVGVDLWLREFVVVVFEPKKEGVLEREGFGASANRGPKEQDPARHIVRTRRKLRSTGNSLQHGCAKDSLDQ